MADFDLNKTGQEVQDILDGAAMQTDLTAETERAELAEQTLQGGIDTEETRAKAAEKQNADDIDSIEAKIPAGASSENQLADKQYVNNAIATASATYRGTYNEVSDLSLTVDATHEQIATALAGAIDTADNNDYAFVQIPTSTATPTQIAAIERYKFNGTAWSYEYTLNNSGFTADQWTALNSGITSGLVAKLIALPTNEALTLALAGKQDVMTFDNVPVDGSNNPVKSGGVYSAINDEATRAKAAEKANADDIDDIEVMIPTAASDENQLADKQYVNDGISTASATYRGSYNEVSELSLTIDATHSQIAAALAVAISTADNNDYAFVQIPTSDATPTQIASIERYKFNGTAWSYEYTLNNSGFTADQWAALNSGITSGLVAKLSALPTNDALTQALAGKQDVLTFDNVPTSGSNNPVKSGGVHSAIDAEATTRAAAIAAIVALIPEAASALNQLADKAFVNSSISTATAVFKGTFNVVVDLELSYNASQQQIALMLASKIISADNNDYCFVQIPTSNETPLEIARTDRYKFNGTAWAYEYTLNNSGFTAAQWAAINSGITSLLKDKLIDLPTATELTTLLAAKQNQLTFDTTPTTDSTNPVTSGGIKSAIDAEKARAEAAEADRYTKSETYNKTEIDGLVSTPHQNYVTVPTYASLPSSGQSTDTIYRVSSYDGVNSQVDNTVYSEYAWDGTQYVFLDVKSQIEEVFDITEYNSGTKYADLSAALGVDGANIPATLRRGGMSIKYVQSSDNKYVMYNLPTDTFTVNANEWKRIAYAIEPQVHKQIGTADDRESFKLAKTLNIGDKTTIFLKASGITGAPTIYTDKFQAIAPLKITGNWERYDFKCTNNNTNYIFIKGLADGDIVLFEEMNTDREIEELYNEINSTVQNYIPSSIEMDNIAEYRKMVFHVTEPQKIPQKQINFQIFSFSDVFEGNITSLKAKIRLVDLGGDNNINTIGLAHADLPNYIVYNKITPLSGIIELELDLSNESLPYGDESLARFKFYVGNNLHTQYNTTWNFEIDIIELYVNGNILPLRKVYNYGVGDGTTTGCTRTDQIVNKKYDGCLLHKMYFAGLNNQLKGGYKEIKIIGSNELSSSTFAAKNGGTLKINNTIVANIPLYWLNQKYHDTIELNHITGFYEHHKRCDLISITGPFTWINSGDDWYTTNFNSSNYKNVRITLANNYCRAYPNETLPGLSFAWDGNLVLRPSASQNWSSSNDVNTYIASNPINALLPIDEVITVLSNEAQLLLSYLATESTIEYCSDNIDVMYEVDENKEDFVENYKSILPVGIYKQSTAEKVIELGGTIEGEVYDNGTVESPNVIYDNDEYKMVYTGYKKEGGILLYGSPILAKSHDLTNWTKTKVLLQPNESILSPYKGSITGPVLRKKDGLYYLYFIGCDKPGYEQGNKSLCLAVSRDMNTWYDVIGAPILESMGINRSTWYCGMAIYHADFIIHNGLYYCFINANGNGYSLDDNVERIGYAVGSNPLEFTFDETPVITSNNITTYDNCICGDPCLFDIGDDNIYMFYFSARTGYVVSGECMAYTLKKDFPKNWKKYSGNPFIPQAKSSVIYVGGKQYHFLGSGDGIFLYINEI